MEYHTAKRLADFAHEKLGSLVKESGHLLYSDAKSLDDNQGVYLLGFNPGGKPDGVPIESHLQKLPSKTTNDYFQAWDKSVAGKSRLQCRLRWLMSELELDLTKVVASNLVFVRSPRRAVLKTYHQSEPLGERELIERCWPVHEWIIKAVDPRLILVFGKSHPSAYSILKESCMDPEIGEESDFAGHSNWKFGMFKTTDERFVVEIPHLSLYNIIPKKASKLNKPRRQNTIDMLRYCLEASRNTPS